MSNQWGRDTQLARRPGGSPAGLLVAILVSLLLGAAAGYGAMRYLTAPDADRLAKANEQIASLSAELDDSNRRLAEAAEARKRAETALGASDPQSATLRQTLDSQRAELDTMADSLEATSRQLLAEKEENARLAKALADANRIDLAREESIETARREAAARKEAEAALAELRQRLEASEGEARQSLAQLETVEVPRLRKELAELAERLAKTEADRDRIAAELSAGDAALAQAQRGLKAAEDGLARERQRSGALMEERDAALAASTPGEETTPAGSSTASSQAPENIPLVVDEQRDPKAVDAVLERTPGLDRLSSSDFQKLRTLLISGECVTTGLQSVFRTVPVVTLRNLMRDLKSDC